MRRIKTLALAACALLASCASPAYAGLSYDINAAVDQTARTAANNAQTTANNAQAGSFYGAAWNNVTASRALGTTYTNTTGKTIQACVTVTSTASGTNMTVTVAGVAIFKQYGQANLAQSVLITVPNGATYAVSATNTPTYSSWFELY